MNWCHGPDCSQSYTFSASHFQMKLKSFYETGRRPPLKEAYYISKTPPDFFEQLINECPALPIQALLLISLAKMSTGDIEEGERTLARSEEIFGFLRPLQHTILKTAWPHDLALEAVARMRDAATLAETKPLRIHVVLYGCDNPELTIESAQSLLHLFPGVGYEILAYNCGQGFSFAWLNHIRTLTESVDWVIFLNGRDFSIPYTKLVVKSVAKGLLPKQTVVSLGFKRSPRVHKICGTGAVPRASWAFYGGSFVVSGERVRRSATHLNSIFLPGSIECGPAFQDEIWSDVFEMNTAQRDDPTLPIGLRLRYGDEHVRVRWTDVEFGPVVPSRPIEMPPRGLKY